MLEQGQHTYGNANDLIFLMSARSTATPFCDDVLSRMSLLSLIVVLTGNHDILCGRNCPKKRCAFL